MHPFVRLFVFTSLIATGSSATAAVITGDVSGGGNFSDNVAYTDGWITESATSNGVDFWTLNAESGDQLDFNAAGDASMALSLYNGTVDGFMDKLNFDHDGDFADLSYTAGNNPFNPSGFGTLSATAAQDSTYTLAVGGAGDGFGVQPPVNYELSVSQVNEVPSAPSMALMLGGGLVWLASAAGRRRRLGR